jgi:hypothetical protein
MALKAAVIIGGHVDNKTGITHHTMKLAKLCVQLKRSGSVVRELISELCKKGYLRKVEGHGRGRPPAYRLAMPSETKPSDGGSETHAGPETHAEPSVEPSPQGQMTDEIPF